MNELYSMSCYRIMPYWHSQNRKAPTGSHAEKNSNMADRNVQPFLFRQRKKARSGKSNGRWSDRIPRQKKAEGTKKCRTRTGDERKKRNNQASKLTAARNFVLHWSRVWVVVALPFHVGVVFVFHRIPIASVFRVVVFVIIFG